MLIMKNFPLQIQQKLEPYYINSVHKLYWKYYINSIHKLYNGKEATLPKPLQIYVTATNATTLYQLTNFARLPIFSNLQTTCT